MILRVIKTAYQLNKATVLATRLFEDANKAFVWMGTPNDIFFQESPCNWILANKGQGVIQFLEERLG